MIRVAIGSVLCGVAVVALGVALKPPAIDATSKDIGLRVEPARISAAIQRDKFPLRAPIASSAPAAHVRVASLAPHAQSYAVTNDQGADQDSLSNDQDSLISDQDSPSDDQDLLTYDPDMLQAIPASGWWHESFDERFPGLVTQELASDSDFLLRPDDDARTAIYDIAAHAVYLPNGRRLEAHSGLGAFRDNPEQVHVRMRGATPPNVYILSLRKKLFHGVKAIRLTPKYENLMFGRDGMLAHSYMHGANGQSNGCVAFSDYPEFLNAFLEGEITRLVVVDRLENPPEPKAVAGSASESVANAADQSERAGQYAAADAH